MRNDEFIKAAQSFVGVRFHHMGRSRLGMDCSGLVVAACRSIGEGVSDEPHYGVRPNPHTFTAAFDRNFERVDEIKPGRIGVFWWDKRNTVDHCGIFGHGTLIHSWAQSRKVVEHPYPDKFWSDRLTLIYRLRTEN